MSNTGMASWIVRIAAILLELILAITVFQLGMRVASGVWGFLLGILGLVALSGVWGVFLSTKSPKRLRPMGRGDDGSPWARDVADDRGARAGAVRVLARACR